MKEVNPRSQIRSMKLRYFLTVTGLTTGIFILLYIIAQILFMIFELQPYVRLAIAVLLFVADAMIVNRIVNYHWIERWMREEAVDRGGLEAPEPEYVMDDEMVRNLTLQQKLKKPLFSWKKKQEEPAEETDGPKDAVKPETKKAAAAKEAPLPEGDWKTPFDELETMRFSLDEQERNPQDETTDSAHAEEIKTAVSELPEKTETFFEEPIGKHGKRRREKPAAKEAGFPDAVSGASTPSWQIPFDEIPTGDIASVHESGSEAPLKETAAKKAKPKEEEVKEEAKGHGFRTLFRRPKEETVLEVKSDGGRRAKEKASAKKTRNTEKRTAEKSSQVSSWKVPFDEMPTADLSAVLDPSSETTAEIGATITEEAPEASLGKERRLRRLFQRSAEETVIEVHENKNASVIRKKKERKPEKKAERKTERKPEKKQRPNSETKAKNSRKAKSRNKTPEAVQEPVRSSWSTPFDEMPTEELPKAVENAVYEGYNPYNSDEGNK